MGAGTLEERLFGGVGLMEEGGSYNHRMPKPEDNGEEISRPLFITTSNLPRVPPTGRICKQAAKEAWVLQSTGPHRAEHEAGRGGKQIIHILT